MNLRLLQSMLLLIFRFVVFAAIYCALVLWWAAQEGGHGAMGIVAGGIITSGAVIVAWFCAFFVARFVVKPLMRLSVHVALAVVVFVAGSIGIFIVLDFLYPDPRLPPVPFSENMDFVVTLGAITAIAALADGLIGLWKDQRVVRAHSTHVSSSP